MLQQLLPDLDIPRATNSRVASNSAEGLSECIADAMESGELRGTDPDLAAFYLWSRVHGVVMLLGSPWHWRRVSPCGRSPGRG